MRKLGAFLVLLGGWLTAMWLHTAVRRIVELRYWEPLPLVAAVPALGAVLLLWGSRWQVLTVMSRTAGTLYVMGFVVTIASPIHVWCKVHPLVMALLALAIVVVLGSSLLFAIGLDLGTEAHRPGQGLQRSDGRARH